MKLWMMLATFEDNHLESLEFYWRLDAGELALVAAQVVTKEMTERHGELKHLVVLPAVEPKMDRDGLTWVGTDWAKGEGPSSPRLRRGETSDVSEAGV